MAEAPAPPWRQLADSGLFDYRYHALSLAAVLLALAVGVLLGVAIGDSNLVSSAKNGIVATLRSDLHTANEDNAELQQRVANQANVESALYGVAVNGLLTGHDVGLVFLGGASSQIDALVHNALRPTGAAVSVVAAVREPLNLTQIASEARGSRYALLDGPAPSTALVNALGQRLGAELTTGGPLIGRVGSAVFSSLDGTTGHLDGVILVRDDPPAVPAADIQAVNSFESGLSAGLRNLGLPVVGVELTSTNPSQVPWYKAQGLSSVDDLNTLAGRAALALTLTGVPGTFGTKSTASSLLPSTLRPAP